MPSHSQTQPSQLPPRRPLPLKEGAGNATQLTPEEHRIYEFLNRLDSARFEVTDWEAHFIGDLIQHPRSLTRAQRNKVDQLRTQYEGRL